MTKISSDELAQTRDYTADDARFMQMAIDLSDQNVDNGGGPFGAVIVRDGKVLATGVNRVTANNDPTAHAEVSAIRQACAKLATFELDGATIYSSCEPCPMCLSAIYWSGIRNLCYGNTKRDAAKINFDDKFIYDELSLPQERRAMRCRHFMNAEAVKVFEKWAHKPDKIEY